MAIPSYSQYVAVVAPKYALPVALVCAIVKVESGGNRFAHRYESEYPYLWNVRTAQPYRVRAADRTRDSAPEDFPAPVGSSADTEWVDQQASWGLLQVMGAVAREYGFKGFLSGLCDPLDGLHYGCRHLAALRDRFLQSAGWSGVVASYNAGSPRTNAQGQFTNRDYVAKVMTAGGDGLSRVLA